MGSMDASNLKLLYFHSTEIVKDDILWGLLELGIDVETPEYRVELQVYTEQMLEQLCPLLKGADGVITQNFSALVARACFEARIPYISWIYDSPQRALFMKEAKYETNYIFSFDKEQIRRLRKIGVRNLFYCPLAANIAKSSSISITDQHCETYGAPISFVGNLYQRENILNFVENLPEVHKQEMQQLLDSRCFRWDGTSVFGSFSENLVEYICQVMDQKDLEYYELDSAYLAEICILPPLIAFYERCGALQQLAKEHDVWLFTKGSVSQELVGATKIYPPVDMNSDMYRVFYSSKINLNLTMRGIESGVPQRIFDALSVGGFVLSNYQKEAEELFEPDREIVLCRSLEEMKDKADYYLRHERERVEIGIRGYQRVKAAYTYPILLSKILQTVYET